MITILKGDNVLYTSDMSADGFIQGVSINGVDAPISNGKGTINISGDAGINVVTDSTNGNVTIKNIKKIWSGTYAEYKALETYDSDTTYICTDDGISYDSNQFKGVNSATIDPNGELVLNYTNGTSETVGKVTFGFDAPTEDDANKALFGDGHWHNIYNESDGSTFYVITDDETFHGATVTLSNGMGNTWTSTIDNAGNAEFSTIKLGGTFTATAITQDGLHTALSNSDTNTYYGAHVLRLIPQYNKIKVTASYDSAIGASLTAKNSNGNIIAGAVMPQSKEVYLTFSTIGAITITTNIDGIDIAVTQTFSDYGNDVTVPLPLPAYGYCIDEDNSDPDTMVTYTDAAVGMTPAHMDFTNDVFDYGSWENAFFMPKPCMLKFDGTVDYYLDPNDYTKKADGTASDVADMSYQGNAMMEWPLIYTKHWEVGNKKYCLIAPTKLDNDFHAYANIGHDGTLGHFYTSIYNGSWENGADTRMRSMSGATGNYGSIRWKGYSDAIGFAELNGANWHIGLAVDRFLLADLIVLLGRSTGSQAVYGRGIIDGNESAITSYVMGSLDDKGLFYGKNDNSHAVKVFGMENCWGFLWDRLSGWVWKNNKHYLKLTYGTQDGSTSTGYNADGDGYIDTGLSMSDASSSYIGKMNATTYGLLQAQGGGSSSTKYCDYMWASEGTHPAMVGVNVGNGYQCGIFGLDVYNNASYTNWYIGHRLSYKP